MRTMTMEKGRKSLQRLNNRNIRALVKEPTFVGLYGNAMYLCRYLISARICNDNSK